MLLSEISAARAMAGHACSLEQVVCLEGAGKTLGALVLSPVAPLGWQLEAVMVCDQRQRFRVLRPVGC